MDSGPITPARILPRSLRPGASLVHAPGMTSFRFSRSTRAGAPAAPSSSKRGAAGGPTAVADPAGAPRAARVLRRVFAVAYVCIVPLGLGRLVLAEGQRHGPMMAAYALLFAIGVCAWNSELLTGARRIRAHPLRALGTLALGVAILLALEAVGSLIAGWLAGVVPGGAQDLGNDTSISRILGAYPRPVVVAVLGVMGPFVEELFFRQFLIPLIGDRTRSWVGVVVSGILFGMLHMSSLQPSEWIGIIPHMCFGLAMGILFLRSHRNLLLPAGIHILNNASTFLANT